MSAHFAFAYYDLPRRRWVRTRYLAQLATIAERHECFRLLAPPEIRGDGDPARQTAGHLARSPKGQQ